MVPYSLNTSREKQTHEAQPKIPFSQWKAIKITCHTTWKAVAWHSDESFKNHKRSQWKPHLGFLPNAAPSPCSWLSPKEAIIFACASFHQGSYFKICSTASSSKKSALLKNEWAYYIRLYWFPFLFIILIYHICTEIDYINSMHTLREDWVLRWLSLWSLIP